MLPLERHRLIVELLGQHGVMRVDEIAQATRFLVKRYVGISVNWSEKVF